MKYTFSALLALIVSSIIVPEAQSQVTDQPNIRYEKADPGVLTLPPPVTGTPAAPGQYQSPPQTQTYRAPLPTGEPLENMVDRHMKRDIPEGIYDKGLGFIVDDRGHVITASHILSRCSAFVVQDRYGELHDAILIGMDTRKDIAIIRTDAGLGLPLEVSAGFPIDNGIVSAGSGEGIGVNRQFLRTSIAGNLRLNSSTVYVMRPALPVGASGGPILGSDGRVYGIAVGKWSPNGQEESIATTGRSIVEFLNYHGIQAPSVQKSGKGWNLGFGKNDSDSQAVWERGRESILNIKCTDTK